MIKYFRNRFNKQDIARIEVVEATEIEVGVTYVDGDCEFSFDEYQAEEEGLLLKEDYKNLQMRTESGELEEVYFFDYSRNYSNANAKWEYESLEDYMEITKEEYEKAKEEYKQEQEEQEKSHYMEIEKEYEENKEQWEQEDKEYRESLKISDEEFWDLNELAHKKFEVSEEEYKKLEKEYYEKWGC